VCHGFVTGGARKSDGGVPGPSRRCDAGARYARSRTVRDPRCSVARYGRASEHRKEILRCSLLAYRPSSEHGRPTVFLIRSRDGFRTPQAQALPWFQIHLWGGLRTTQRFRGSKTSAWPNFRTTESPDRSDPTLSVASPERDDHVSLTSCRPCAGSPTDPSRPGRLMAVTASQGRHETPRTDHGQALRPRSTAAPPPTFAPRSARFATSLALYRQLAGKTGPAQ
jgi:hypothetical protein